MFQVILHEYDDQKIAEIISDEVILQKTQDALDIMANAGARKIILHRKNIAPEFFDLKNRIAGDILQKLVNYQVQLAIVGDFSDITSDSFKALMIESNRGNDVFFVEDAEAASRYLYNMLDKNNNNC